MTLTARLGPLGESKFRLLWLGRTTSGLGDALTTVALAFAVLEVGGSASELGLVIAGVSLTRVLFVLVGGVIADRLPRRLLVLASDAWQGVVQAIIAVALFTGHGRVWMLLAAGVLYGAARALFTASMIGLVPETVSESRLQQANALLGMSRSAARVVGPALGGIVIAAAGPGWAYAIDAATFATSATCLALLRLPAPPPRPRASILADLTAGWRELRARRWYLLNLGVHGVWNFALTAFIVLGPIISAQRLGGASAWGVILTGGAIGALLGGVVALRWMPHRPLVVANLAMILSVLQFLALAVPTPAIVIATASAIGMIGLTFLSEVWTTTMQQLIPEHLISRLSSYDWLISLVVMPAGYALAGPIAAHTSNRATLIGAAVLIGVPCLFVVLVPGVRAVHRTASGRIVSGPVSHPGGPPHLEPATEHSP